MLIKAKYVGNGESNLTVNQDYVVLGFYDRRLIIIDDNGVLYRTIQDYDNAAQWQLVSVNVIGSISIFP